MRKVSGNPDTPILTGLTGLKDLVRMGSGSGHVGCGTEVGQRTGMVGDPEDLWDGTEDGKRIIHRLGYTLPNEHGCTYWVRTS